MMRDAEDLGVLSLIQKWTKTNRRYQVVMMAVAAVLFTVGSRASFALLMVHVTNTHDPSVHPNYVVFQETCPTGNKSFDLRLKMGSDVVFVLHTAYFCAYAISVIPGSILASIYSTVRVVGLSVLFHSVITLALANSIHHHNDVTFFLRIIHGIIEGISHPALVTVVSSWTLPSEATRSTAILAYGIYTAPALASLSTAAALCFVSWDSILYIYGSFGIVWACFWFHAFYDTPVQDPNVSSSENALFAGCVYNTESGFLDKLRSIPWRMMVQSPSVWTVFSGAFCENSVLAFLLMALPQYLLDSYNIRAVDSGVLSVAPYLAKGLTAVVGGVISNKLVCCGLHKNKVRKIIYFIAYGVEGAVFMSLLFISDWKLAFLLIVCGVAVGGMAVSAYAPIITELIPCYTTAVCGLALTGSIGAAFTTGLASILPGKYKTLESWQVMCFGTALVHWSSVTLFLCLADR